MVKGEVQMILKPILQKLNKTFNSPDRKYPVYTKNVKQGVKLPCFFVRIIETNLDPQMSNFYFLRNLISVTYMSDTGDLYELEKIRFKLLFGLKQIPTLKGVEGYNLQAKIQGDNIIMFGNYDLFIEMVQEKEPYMRVLNDDYFTNDKITLNDINKDLHPELYKKPKTIDYNTPEDLREKGVDESAIDYIEQDLMKKINKDKWRF